jgi:hypothetical protein
MERFSSPRTLSLPIRISEPVPGFQRSQCRTTGAALIRPFQNGEARLSSKEGFRNQRTMQHKGSHKIELSHHMLLTFKLVKI